IEKEKIGYYVWLRSYFNPNTKQSSITKENWFAPHVKGKISEEVSQKLRLGDVKEIWLSIDADAFSLRDVIDWGREKPTRPGYFDMDEAAIKKDLEDLRQFLNLNRISPRRIVLAESETYLNKRENETPAFIRQ